MMLLPGWMGSVQGMSDPQNLSVIPEPVVRPEAVGTAAQQPPLDSLERVSEQALSAAVDALAYPMMTLQADGLLLHANKAAMDVLGVGEIFVLSATGQVVPKPATRRAEFVAAMQAAAGGQMQQLIWAEGKLTVHASLRLLGPAATSAAAPHVLLMMAPPADAVFDATGFAVSHRLSNAETRVLEALMHGNHAEDTAKRLGVGVATVRSQIAAIRKKTGHDNVASLLVTLGDLPPLRRVEKPAGAAKGGRVRASAKAGAKPIASAAPATPAALGTAAGE